MLFWGMKEGFRGGSHARCYILSNRNALAGNLGNRRRFRCFRHRGPESRVPVLRTNNISFTGLKYPDCLLNDKRIDSHHFLASVRLSALRLPEMRLPRCSMRQIIATAGRTGWALLSYENPLAPWKKEVEHYQGKYQIASQ